jgi:hypothetical protein
MKFDNLIYNIYDCVQSNKEGVKISKNKKLSLENRVQSKKTKHIFDICNLYMSGGLLHISCIDKETKENSVYSIKFKLGATDFENIIITYLSDGTKLKGTKFEGKTLYVKDSIPIPYPERKEDSSDIKILGGKKKCPKSKKKSNKKT